MSIMIRNLWLVLGALLAFALVLFSNQIAVTQISQQFNKDWQYAAKVAPSGLMAQVAEDNIKDAWLGDPNRMKVLKIQVLNQKSPLYLIDSRVQYKCPPIGCEPTLDPLCSSSGCAYLGYVQEDKAYRRVLSQYFKSSLTPDIDFIRVSKQLNQGLPCLEFRELPKLKTGRVQVSQYCFDEQQYLLERKFEEPRLSK